MIRPGHMMLALGGLVLVVALGFALYFAAFWGLLGGWFMPRGTDRAKLAALEHVQAALRVGLTTEEARAVARDSKGQVWETNINTDRWFGQTIDDKNFMLGITFKRTSWVGPIITNFALVATIHDGVVADVRTQQTTSAP